MLNFLNGGFDEKDDVPYETVSKLPVNFLEGKKYAYVFPPADDIEELIDELLGDIDGGYDVEDFKISTKGNKQIIEFPDDINPHDYHALIQDLTAELEITTDDEEQKIFGEYQSDDLTYYVFQDPYTLSNLLGFTSDKMLFSLHTGKDDWNSFHLKLNPNLEVEAEWVEEMIG